MLKRKLSLILLVIISLTLSGCLIKSKKPIVPEHTVIVTSAHTADMKATSIKDKYKNALKISATEISSFFDYDEDINVEIGEDGITFTSTVSGDIKGDKNRFVRLGYQDGQGYLNLTALEGKTGKIGVDLYADLDLTKTTNGFYVRLKQDSAEIGNFHRESSGVYLPDTIFSTYTNTGIGEDTAYIEITLPWQGSITVKGIYLYMESEVTGFAGMADQITGGEGALEKDIYTVTNPQELHAALQSVSARKAPSIINVDGTIAYDDWVAVSGKTQREIQLNMDNLSIIGVGSNALFDGVGFKVSGYNIIIQNLTIRQVLTRDGIQINGAKYVMIDHCTLYNEPPVIESDKDKYDELISIKNDSEYVILSWNHLYDSHKTILIGSNDDVDALPDRKVIMHHNYIIDSNSRLPLFRGGHGHIYNNYFVNNRSGTGINCRTGSKILIENNYFEDIKDPIGYWFDTNNPSGLWDLRGNEFDSCRGNWPTESTTTLKFEESYTYDLDPVIDVPNLVINGAGVGKI